MPIVKGLARIISEREGEVLAGGMCYLNAQEDGRNAGSLSRLVWRDPAPVLSEAETYLLEFMETGRWLRIRFQRIGATTCGPVIARFQGIGPLREE